MSIFSVTALLLCCLYASHGSVLKSNSLQESLYENIDGGSGEEVRTTTSTDQPSTEVTSTVGTSTEHPRDAGTVTLHVSNITITQFNLTLQESFKESMAKHLTTYCNASRACGADTAAVLESNVHPVADDSLIWNSVKDHEAVLAYQSKQTADSWTASPIIITKDDVNITSITQEGHGVQVELHVQLKSTSGDPYVIPQQTVEETIEKYAKEIAIDTGLEVTVVRDPVVPTTTTEASITTPAPEGGDGLTGWQIALIAVACVVFGIVTIAVLAYCCYRKNNKVSY